MFIISISYFDYDKLVKINCTSNKMFYIDSTIINGIYKTKDNKIEIINFKMGGTLIQLKSSIVNDSCFSVNDITLSDVKYVLLDLDGTSINSEKFWIEMIRKTISTFLTDFNFEESDLPFISGHTVLEHLSYCNSKYSLNQDIVFLKNQYYKIVNDELDKLKQGNYELYYFEPRKGLKKFLETLKNKNIKIGLVTSGNNEKVYPIIDYVFKRIGINQPLDYFDCIITGGNRLKNGSLGSIGEIFSKPYPCLYSECIFSGFNIKKNQLKNVIAIEDSAAGVYSIITSGIIPIGIDGGNIIESGADALCYDYVYSFDEIIEKYIES